MLLSWRILLGPLVLAIAAGGERAARGDDLESARLTYSARTSPAVCPDEESFRQQVAARLGYQPFRDDGKHQVSIALSLDAGKVRGRASVRRAGAVHEGVRELDVEASKCDALVAALAASVAVAIDPPRFAHGDAHAEAAPAPPIASAPAPVAPAPAALIAPAPAPPSSLTEPPPRAPITPFGGAAAGATFAQTPTPALAIEVGVGLRRRAFSLELGGRVESTVGDPRLLSGDQVDATVFSGLLYPCVHLNAWSACASARLGVLQGRASDVEHPSLGSTVIGALGVRAGYTLPVSRLLGLRLTAQIEAPLVRTSLYIGERPVWIAPPIAGSALLGIFFLPEMDPRR